MLNDVVLKRSSLNPFEKVKISTRNPCTIFVVTIQPGV